MPDLTPAAAFYRENGYLILRGIIPPALLTDLRRTAEEARVIARRLEGPQAQRLQPLGDQVDLAAVRVFAALPELAAVLAAILTPRHHVSDPARMALLFEPAEHCWSTEWHRDWRQQMTTEQFEQVFGVGRWARLLTDLDYFNQINAALYEDTATWYVPGSHFRPQDTPEEIRAAHSADRAAVENWNKLRTEEEQERFLHDYCAGMPGAVQVALNAGDLLLYRNLGWHLGSYLPYRKRATLHCSATTPEFMAFGQENAAVMAKMRAALIAAKAAGAGN